MGAVRSGGRWWEFASKCPQEQVFAMYPTSMYVCRSWISYTGSFRVGVGSCSIAFLIEHFRLVLALCDLCIAQVMLGSGCMVVSLVLRLLSVSSKVF